jgi:hypothetical protein
VCVAHRRYCDDYTAHWLTMRRLVRNTYLGHAVRPFTIMWHGTSYAGRLPMGSYVGRRPMGSYVLFGLLAGLSAALGFLVPPRSRLTAVH